jgi:hypothetical protein
VTSSWLPPLRVRATGMPGPSAGTWYFENVRDRPPEKLRWLVQRHMGETYHADSALAAEAWLTALATELDKTHPGASRRYARVYMGHSWCCD